MSDEKSSRIEHNRQLLKLILKDTRSYHDHKENMAHAGLLLQTGFLIWILSNNNWLKTYLVWGIPFFIFIWLLIHIYIRWQLRNRRWAAITIEAVERTLKKWADSTPNNEKMDTCCKNAKSRKYCLNCLKSIILRHIDYLIPCPKASLDSDIKKDIWPKDLCDEWTNHKKKSTGALCGECFLFLGSITILVLGVLSLIFGN
jgi:hypothetical protein